MKTKIFIYYLLICLLGSSFTTHSQEVILSLDNGYFMQIQPYDKLLVNSTLLALAQRENLEILP